jgi:penicillin-binding protein 2
MFERRLKIFLMLLFAVTGVLVLRAAQVQVVQREEWREKAAETMKRSRAIETVRGNIVDVKGRVVAMDRPCIDACVDFRALTDPPDEKWVRDVAAERLVTLRGDAYKSLPRAKRVEALNAEVVRVKADIGAMWDRLSEVSGVPRGKILETRDGIVHKVLMRRRAVWYRNYHLAVKKFAEREPAPAWRRWLVDESAEAPQAEDFEKLTVAEELQDHPILKAVDNPVQNELRKHIEDYPGLVLRPGTERHYPFMDAGCHLLGSLARVDREDLKKDPNVGKDELRQYYPNDLIGRGGIEGLAEPLLRGSRGKIVTIEGREKADARIEAKPGRAVALAIDIELQQDVTELFRNAKVVNEFTKPKSYDQVEMHGGAVILDVGTGAVRALVSYPTFDLNQLEEKYNELVTDELDLPLLNRATQVAREPGSTVKPLVGLAGIGAGVIGVHDTIECNGFMVINGRQFSRGKCWTQSMFGIGHHHIPSGDPHPDGLLTFSDAVQRSCNVYFETIGDRLKLDGLSKWYLQFGLGRPTGLGIPETRGMLPNAYSDGIAGLRFATWISAIGQGTTLATPVQMANVAATIARGGVWMRPRLLEPGQDLPAPGSQFGPERVDLGLPREAILAAQEGMTRVVNTEAGSAYRIVRRDDLLIAGKTGTAEAARLKVKVRDKHGKVVLDKDGRPKTEFLQPSSPLNPNLKAPWYRGFGKEGTDLKHSWFIGFAPAEKPEIAFAVMLEYGGSGGTGAGLVAKGLIDICVERGYLKPDPADARGRGDAAQPAGHVEGAPIPELLVGD